MFSTLGLIAALFTAWAERLLDLNSTLRLGPWTCSAVVFSMIAAGLVVLAFIAVASRYTRLGGFWALLAALSGFIAAHQLWTTAGSLLFLGAIFWLFAPDEDRNVRVHR